MTETQATTAFYYQEGRCDGRDIPYDAQQAEEIRRNLPKQHTRNSWAYWLGVLRSIREQA